LANGLLAVLLIGVLALLAPAAAWGQALPDDVEAVFDDFRADGVIDPCRHTVAELRRAEDAITDEIEELSPDLPGAVAAAIEGHERGECDDSDDDPTPTATPSPSATASPAPSPTESPTPAPSATASPAPSPTAAPESEAVPVPPVATPSATPTPTPSPAVTVDEGGEGVPAPVWALAAAGALAALAGALWLLVASRGRRDRAAFAWREAAWRAQGTWLDFRDWVRIGR
jgi:hypothetical protein